MAAAPNPAVDLCVLDDVKAYLGEVSASADDLLQRLITAISAAAATYCSRNFLQATYAEVCSGTGTALLLPHNQPITAVASLVQGSYSFSPANSDRSAGFSFDDKCLYLLGGAKFCNGIQNIVVSYTAGYTAAALSDSTIPADLREAVVEAVADRFKKRTLIGIQSKTIAGETITYTTRDFPAAVKLTLNLYSRVSFG